MKEVSDSQYKILPLTKEYVNGAVEMHMIAFQDFFLAFLGQGFLRELYKAAAGHEQTVGYVAVDQNNQVITRTNQFNLTTKRHSEQSVREWSKDPNWKIMSYSAEDRFGSYGIVGVTILKRLSDSAEIDSLLLSCRAMGKGIEDVMIAVVANQTRQMGLTNLRATYIPTKKNIPIRDFLPAKGFLQNYKSEEITKYFIELKKQNLPVPEYVTFENIN